MCLPHRHALFLSEEDRVESTEQRAEDRLYVAVTNVVYLLRPSSGKLSPRVPVFILPAAWKPLGRLSGILHPGAQEKSPRVFGANT
jgi:hypothetical protein